MDQVTEIDVAELRNEVKSGLQALQADYEQHCDAVSLLHRRCQQVDGVLQKLWAGMGLPADLTLAAVGGYGRGELYPGSDIDLLILLPAPPDAALEAQLERLVGHFWDIGLEIGHSVRTVDDCLKEAAADITVETSLIETRLLAGNTGLFEEYRRKLRDLLDPVAFFEAKRLEQQERHLRFNETPYAVEPNFKDAPGGLRDLQVIFWIAQVAGYGTTWADLEKHGFLTREEMQHAESCEGFLRHLRISLHFTAGRREDRLLFDYQTSLAQQFGFQDTPAKRASEQLMQGYYRNAKAITDLNTILLQNMGAALAPDRGQAPQPIDEDFQAVGDLLDVRDENLFDRKPCAILDSFLVMQECAELRGMTARTLRALWRARDLITPEFRADPRNKALFVKLFQSPRGVVHEFRRMNQLDILGSY
ncbi:MAG TPA: nucleotidyltransferase domain-containing protein, partial [Rhodocyclaceae bacterium]|nr:nucleotidyltransferase domain-containing protein [Rhodocyclaceae bacterium]